jgi:hypothetical protein
MITTLRIPAFCAVAASVSLVPAVRGAEDGLSKEAAAAKVEAVWKERRAVLEKERAQAGFKEIVARVASLRAILDRTNAEIRQIPLAFNKQSAFFPE